MVVPRPSSPSQTFESINSCFIGQIDGGLLYPPSKLLSRIEQPVAELIFESVAEDPTESRLCISTAEIREAVRKAYTQYLENVGELEVEERFQDYLTDEFGVSVQDAVALLRIEGIAPFLILKRIFVSEPLAVLCFDFSCFGEEYLDEYEFSFDLYPERVEFVTPRGLMPEGSFPASRHN
jgi:hypothetical protein